MQLFHGAVLAMGNAKHIVYSKNHEVYLHLVQTNADEILSALVCDVNKLPMQAWAGRSAYVQCHQVDTRRAVLNEESQLVLSVQSLRKADNRYRSLFTMPGMDRHKPSIDNGWALRLCVYPLST